MRRLLFSIAFVLLFPLLVYAGNVKTLGGVADSSVKNVDGVVGTSVKTTGGGDYNDGDVAGHTDYTALANCRLALLFLAQTCGGGTDWCDSSVDANHLTPTGTPAAVTDVPTGFSTDYSKAMDFDGTNDYILRTHANLSANFPGKKVSCTAFAGAIWVKADANNQINQAMSKGGYDAAWGIIRNYSEGYITQLSVVDTDWTVYATTTLGTQDISWHHFAWSWNGAALTVWVDGSEHASSPFTTTGVDTMNVYASHDFSIGAKYDASNDFAGLVFQPIVFDATFSSIGTGLGKTEDEVVTEIYTYGITGTN